MKRKIAVLMLTKNSARWLDEVLTPIHQQSNKHLIRLVLVDGFSEDSTVEIAKQYFPNLVLHQQSSRNLAQLRNIALRLGEKLEPEYMCFIDSDIVVPPHFFDRALKCLSDEKVGIAGVRFELERDPAKAFVSKFYRNRIDIKRKGVYQIDYTTTACSMWKAELSEGIVLDERLRRAGEDVDFNLQITKQGYMALVDADDPPAWHIRNPSIREELHRTKDHGFARALLLKLHPKAMLRSRKYKTFAAAILVLSGWIGLALTPIIGLWGLLPFASFFGRHWLKTKSKWRLDFAFFGFLLSVVYFTRFLYGVVKTLEVKTFVAKETKWMRHYLVRIIAPHLYEAQSILSDLIDAKPRPMILIAKAHFKHKGLVGAEIGVLEGHNALSILQMLPMKTLYLVDPYFSQKSSLATYNVAKQKLSKFPQTKFLIKTSDEACKHIQKPLDFLYIDGNHDYEFVKRDIENYFPLIKRGGIIGGHDYTKDFPGVVKASKEFAREHGLELNTIFPDWWIVKT